MKKNIIENYVEKMASKISIDMAFASAQDGNPEGETFINQIIADTKRACKKIVNNARGETTDLRSIAARIDFAEIKEQEK